MGSAFRGVVAMLMCTASLAAHAIATDWTIVDLTPEGMGIATAISQNGIVVGCRNTSGNFTAAFAYSNGQRRDLTAPPGSTSCGLAVNNIGLIAGRIDGEITVWGQDGNPRRLGVQGNVTGISESGVVVGSLTDASTNTQRAFMWSNGTFTDLGVQGTAAGINARGQIAVVSSTGNLFIFENGNLRAVGDRTVTNAYGIDDRGEIVGMASFGHGPVPFIHDGAVHEIAGAYSYAGAVAINNAGQILGSGEGVYGFLMEGGSATRLDSLAQRAAGNSSWNHIEGKAINDRGWIVGQGGNQGDFHAFLLVPKEAAPAPVAAAQNPATRASTRSSALIRVRSL